jgi:hypothetical protein
MTFLWQNNYLEVMPLLQHLPGIAAVLVERRRRDPDRQESRQLLEQKICFYLIFF